MEAERKLTDRQAGASEVADAGNTGSESPQRRLRYVHQVRGPPSWLHQHSVAGSRSGA